MADFDYGWYVGSAFTRRKGKREAESMRVLNDKITQEMNERDDIDDADKQTKTLDITCKP